MERLAAKVVEAWGMNMPREFYIPKGERVVNLQKLRPEGTDVEVERLLDARPAG